jgi:hypothetical protein
MRYSFGFRAVVCALTSVCLICTSGCSLFVGPTQSVTIRASDPMAKILVDGKEVGTGTVAVGLDRRRSHTVVATSPNGSGAATINKRISGLGVVDIVGGCFWLVPFIGVLGAGFWELEPLDLQIVVH